MRHIEEAITLHCTRNELANHLAATQAAAILAVDATTAVPLASWPVARGGEHGSVRIAQGKVFRESIDAALDWCCGLWEGPSGDRWIEDGGTKD